VALAASYLAEVAIEQHDRKPGRQAAEQGIKAAEKAISLKPEAEYYRVLAIFGGQAITDVLSGLSYGPRARDAVDKAVEKAPKSSSVYVARGVGSYYLPAQLGGGSKQPSPISKRPSSSDPKNAEAYLWLGLSLAQGEPERRGARGLRQIARAESEPHLAKEQLDKTPVK